MDQILDLGRAAGPKPDLGIEDRDGLTASGSNREGVWTGATVKGVPRSGENPARWRGHLAALLPPPSKLRTVKHHAAMPYAGGARFHGEAEWTSAASPPGPWSLPS